MMKSHNRVNYGIFISVFVRRVSAVCYFNNTKRWSDSGAYGGLGAGGQSASRTLQGQLEDFFFLLFFISFIFFLIYLCTFPEEEESRASRESDGRHLHHQHMLISLWNTDELQRCRGNEDLKATIMLW